MSQDGHVIVKDIKQQQFVGLYSQRQINNQKIDGNQEKMNKIKKQMSESKKLKKGICIFKLAITILAILLLFLLFIQFQESNAEINIIQQKIKQVIQLRENDQKIKKIRDQQKQRLQITKQKEEQKKIIQEQKNIIQINQTIVSGEIEQQNQLDQKNIQQLKQEQLKKQIEEQKKIIQEQKNIIQINQAIVSGGIKQQNQLDQKNNMQQLKQEQLRKQKQLKALQQQRKRVQQQLKLIKQEQERQDKVVQNIAPQFKKTPEQFISFLDSMTDLDQIYKFQQSGRLIQPKTALQNNRSQTLFQQFDNKTANGEVTVIFTTSGRYQYLQKSLVSFFKYNTYPIKKLIVAQDGPLNQDVQKVIETYQNITWVISNLKIGQAALIDVAYKFIQTEYYFHSEDDWQFQQPGFIQYSLNLINRYPNVSHVSLKQDNGEFRIRQKWRIQTFKESPYAGFSFNPSLHKLQDYSRWPGGYSNMTHFSSFGFGVGSGEDIISRKYIMAGKFTAISNIRFITHFGARSSDQKYWMRSHKTKRTQKIQEDMQTYIDWFDQKQMQQLKQEQLRKQKQLKALQQQRKRVQQQLKLIKQEQERQDKVVQNIAPQFKKTPEQFISFLDSMTDLDQIYKFQQSGRLIQPKTALQNNRSQTLFQQFDNKTANGEVTVIFTTSGRYQYLQKSLVSFFKYNTYPIKKLIVAQDGPLNQDVQKVIETYQNITWVISNLKIGQAALIDVAYKFIQTEYYFHSEDDWQFQQPGFIQYSLNLINRYPNVSHVSLKQDNGEFRIRQKWRIQTFKESPYAGFSFNPSLHKLQDYSRWPGGYSNMTHFSSFGFGVGSGEDIISRKYIMAGKFTAISNIRFITHFGARSSDQKYWMRSHKTKRTQKIQEDMQTYIDWFDQKYMQQLKQEQLRKQKQLN